MKRLFPLPLLAGLVALLAACSAPEPEPAPLSLVWEAVLVTPDRKLEFDAAAGDRYVYVLSEELPLDGDYTRKWASLWRVDAANGGVLGTVKFPDDAAAATLAANGFGCPQPLSPDLVVDGQGAVYAGVALRNAAAQADGCDTFDGSWVASNWAVFGVFDADLNRTGLAWLKAFGGDDPTYAAPYAWLARADAGAVVAGAYRADARILQTQTFRGSLSPDGTLNVALEGPLGEHVYRAHSLPEGWLAVERPDDPNVAGWSERLTRYDAAGNVVWEVTTARVSFPPTLHAAGVPGRPGTVYVSGEVLGGDPFLGSPPPANEPNRAPFVARIDDGSLTWIRWLTAEETEWFNTDTYVELPLVYDPAYDEVYVAGNTVLLALDPADGATRWVTNLPEIIDGDRVGLSDWFVTYQPQSISHLFLVGNRIVAVNYSFWDFNGDPTSPNPRNRPMLMGFERRY